jgi:hypothetical protein
MCKSLWLAAVCGLLASAGLALGQDDTRAVIDKAVKAHGGLEKLQKFKKSATQMRGKGTVHELGGFDITLEGFGQDGQSKEVIEGEVAGQKFTQTVLMDGKKIHLFINGKEYKLDEKRTDALAREHAHQEAVIDLVFADKKTGYKLSPLGEVKVNDKPAVGVRVSSEGYRDVNLFFDKASGLLVKTEARTTDVQSGEEKTEEKLLSDYKESEGVQRPGKVVVFRDGKKLLTLQIEEVKVVDKFDKDFFTKP